MTEPGVPTQPGDDAFVRQSGTSSPAEAEAARPSCARVTVAKQASPAATAAEGLADVSGEAAASAKPEVDIGGWVKVGWDLFAKNIGPAIGIPLVVLVPAIGSVLAGYSGVMILAVLSDQHKRGGALIAIEVLGVVFGVGLLILALAMPALEAGTYACFLGGIRTGKLTAANLGAGFRQWWACTWVTWVMGLVTLLCLPFVIILVGLPLLCGIHSLRWLALFRIVDQGRGGMEALAFAWNAMRGRLWMMLLFTFLMVTLMTAGASAMYFGALVTAPVGVAALAAGYEAMSKRARGEGS